MYPALSHIVDRHRMLANGKRIFELINLSFKKPVRRKKAGNVSLEYFLSRIHAKSTVVDIGLHDYEYLHTMRLVSRKAERLIVFEAGVESRKYFLQKIETLQLNNVTIEQIYLAVTNENVFAGRQLCNSGGAMVIDFAQKVYKTIKQVKSETLEDFFKNDDQKPDFIRINAEGEELSILQGATALLTRYPLLMMTCEERHAGRERIWETFHMLTDLGYNGYFFLGETKIPIANFDFNIYQNPICDFYCKDFIFE